MTRPRPAPPPAAGDGLALDRQLCFAVYSTSHAFTRLYKALLDPLGLTYPQYLVLLVLWEEDGLTVKQIGARLQLDSGTLTPLLKRMAADSLLVRTRDLQDERMVRITLTEKGRTLRQPVADARQKVACATGLSPPQIEEFKLKIDALRNSLAETTEPS